MVGRGEERCAEGGGGRARRIMHTREVLQGDVAFERIL